MPVKFCSYCATELVERIPDGDDRLRPVCPSCGFVHYTNPVTVVGCLVERGDEILLCKRAIEPSLGLWTVPAGYLELGEGLLVGARRETMEEAGADVEIVAPHSLLDLPHIGQTYALFRARLKSPSIEAGKESLEVEFCPPEQIQWQDLAFPAVHFALELLLDDRKQNRACLHMAQLIWSGSGTRFDARNYSLKEHLLTPLA